MRNKAIPATLLSLFITLIATGTNVQAADDTEVEYDVTARVVRVSLIKGEVSVKRQGSGEWESAKVNLPLVEGDTLATGSDGRVEIQIDARNFARLASDSVLKIVTLRNEGIALSLSRGTAAIRLARFDRDLEYFEIDAPKTTIAAERKGLYRIDVAENGRVQVTVRDDGRARIYSETSGFIVRDGHTATLDYQGSDEGDWHFAQAPAKDGWDDWVTSREAYLAARLRYDDRVRYYDSDIWGAEELDAYGNWAYANDYGWIWRPHVSVINNYNNWAPYRYGNWTWFSPYGWTWVGYEPWGWAPYHYGRWVYYNNYWAWCPRGPNHRRSWWRPALVAFVSFNNFGSHYGWYPLSYHQRDPRSRHYGRDDRLRAMRPEELARLRRVDPAYFRAVTSQAAREFGSHNGRTQPATTELARRAIGMEPLRGDLPVRPAGNLDRNNPAAGDRQARGAMARPAPVTASLAERPTGAAVRRPGVALDDELRRTRVLNGRELLRPANPGIGGNGIGDSVTGAVMRQARPVREPGIRDKENDGNPVDSSPVERPARPMDKPGIRGKDNDSKPGNSSPGGRPARPVRDPVIRDKDVDRNSGDVPSTPRRSEPRDDSPRPARPERTEGPARREPVESPPQRSEPSPRYEPPARSEPPPQRSEPAPRYEPPARSEPPPQRSEPSPRYEPPARSEPPPQRSEPAPRYEPPARSEPAPQRSEPPARSEPPPQRSEPPPQRSEPAPQRSEPARPSEDRPSRAERKNDG